MNNDDKLKELFADYRPQFTDNDEFMQSIEKKLEAVELLKQYKLSNRRRSRIALATAFVLGIIACVAVIALLSAMPGVAFHMPTIAANSLTPWEEIRQGILSLPMFITHNQNLIAAIAFTAITSLGVIKVAISLQAPGGKE